MQYSSLIRFVLPLLILSALAFGQSTSLSLSSTSVQPGASASLSLAVANTAAGGKPASVQFTLGYSSSDFSAVSVSAGAVAAGAGKSIACVPVTGGQTCILLGINNTGMGDGILANVSATLGSSSNVTRSIQVTAPVAASTLGSNLTIGATGGSVTVATPVLLSGLSCGPVSLASGTSSSCTVSLSGAATSSTVVALSSSNAGLTVPASVTVSAGQSTATFSATAGTISADSSAIVTATSGGVSKTTSISLISPAILSSLACAPSSVNSGGTGSCTMSMSKAAISAMPVSLASSNPALTVPASVTVSAGQSTASFSATAGTISVDSSAIVAANLNGVSKTASIGLVSPAVLSSLACAPSSVNSGAAANCTLSMSKAAISAMSVSLASSNPALTVPASITVAAGQSTASFSATAGTISNDAPATVTATSGGVSQTASISLVSPAVLSSLACAPSSVNSGGSATCTMSMSKAAISAMPVSLASNNAVLTVPASVTVSAGQSTATFSATAGTISTDGSATVTATSGGVSQTASISLVSPAVLSSVACAPSSVNSGAATTCTMSMSKAAISAMSVSLASNNAALTVPASVTVSAGQSTATFSATAGTISTDGSATVTATSGGVSQTASISLVSPAVLTSLACAPSSVNSGAATTCTMSMSKAAISAMSVSLASNNVALTVPASTTVAAGQSTASFSATAGTISADASATVTATSGGVSQTASISLISPAVLTSLACAPSSVNSGGSATCTMFMSKAAISAMPVSLASNNAALTVPASVTVAVGQSTVSFSATAGTISADSSAIVTATSGGVSQTASIGLTAPPAVLSSVGCSPSSINSGSNATCTISLSKATNTSMSVSLSSGNASLTVPASAMVAAGQMTAQFSATAATVTTNTTAMVTASAAGTSTTTMVAIQAPQSQLTSISCGDASIQGPASTTCAVKLSSVAPAGGMVVNLADNSSVVSLPSSVTVAAGSTSANFTASAQKVSQLQSVVIRATTGSTSVNTTLTVQPPTTLQSLTCTPSNIAVGASTNCTVLASSPVTRNTTVFLLDSNGAMRTPLYATIRTGNSSVSFTSTAVATSSVPVTITATAFGTTARATITIGGNTTLSMRVVGEPSSVNGEAVNLKVEAADEKDNYTALSVANLPEGARFDASNGSFSWEPAGVANGSYPVTFSARNSSGTTENLEVMVDVTSGAPVVKKLVHSATRLSEGACSAGSIAILEGMGLSHGDEDVQVLVNGNPVRVLKSSSKRIAIQCPDLRAGTQLSVQTKRGAFWSNTLETVSVEAAPGILSLDRAGDEVEIRATGLGSEASLSLDKVQMMMGDRVVPVTAVMMDEEGICHVTVQLPETKEGGEVSLRLALRLNDGHVVESNAVKISIEGRDDHS